MWVQPPEYWVILMVVNIPIFVVIGRVLFGSWADFGEALRFWITPDILSALRGEWGEDRIAEFKLLGLVMLAAITVAGEHVAFVKLGWVE